MSRKVTVLDGYWASGDWECFVFDKLHEHPCEHSDHASEYDDDQCRVYPDVLLPEGAGGRYGRWEITVAFVEGEPVFGDSDELVSQIQTQGPA